MHETAAMRFVEGARYRCTDVNGEFGAETFLGIEQLTQAFAINELHDHGLTTGVLHHIVDRNDVRMIKLRDGNRFTPKTLGEHRV
jgi:hypothetical protein